MWVMKTQFKIVIYSLLIIGGLYYEYIGKYPDYPDQQDRWVRISMTKDEARYYDPELLRKNPNGSIGLEIKRTFRRVQTQQNISYLSEIITTEFNCLQKTHQFIKTKLFNGEYGRGVAEEIRITFESIGGVNIEPTDEVLWNVICDTSGQFHPNK